MEELTALAVGWDNLEMDRGATILLHLSISCLFGLTAVGPARYVMARLQQRSGRTRRNMDDFIASYAEQMRSGTQALARVDTNVAIRMSLNLPSWMNLTHIKLTGAIGLCVFNLALGLPIPLAFVAAVLGWFIVDHILRLRWQRYCERIEQSLPIALARLGPELASNTVLHTALRSLVRHEPHAPLPRYLDTLLSRIQTVGADTALREAMLMADSISETLQTVLFLLGRVQSTGGAAYAGTIESTADRLLSLEQARSEVRSQTRNATLTILIIVMLLFGALGLLVNGSEQVAASFRTALGAILATLAGIWMMVGYLLMTRFVRNASNL